MVRMIPIVVLICTTNCTAGPPRPPGGFGAPGFGPGGPRAMRVGLFISPMGEAFRSPEGRSDLTGAWFAGADANGDASLSLLEMEQDADRFFATLDTDRDGEIEPVEMNRYETHVAPEIQVGAQMGGGRDRGGGGPPGIGGRRPDGPPGSRGPGGPGGGGFGGRDGQRRGPAGTPRGREGAARFGLLDFPQPVAAADTDMNRGVSRAEFKTAAGQRFLLLDTNRDGRIARAELPERRTGGPERRRRGRGAARPPDLAAPPAGPGQ